MQPRITRYAFLLTFATPRDNAVYGHSYICALKVGDTLWEICDVRFDYGCEQVNQVAKTIFQNLADIALRSLLELPEPQSLDIRRAETRSYILDMIEKKKFSRVDVYEHFGVPLPYAADKKEQLPAETRKLAALYPLPPIRRLFPQSICTRLRLDNMPSVQLPRIVTDPLAKRLKRSHQQPAELHIVPYIDLEDVDRTQFVCMGMGRIEGVTLVIESDATSAAAAADVAEAKPKYRKPVGDMQIMPPMLCPPDVLCTAKILQCAMSPSDLCAQLALLFPWATVRSFGFAAAAPAPDPSTHAAAFISSPLPFQVTTPAEGPVLQQRPRFDSLLFSCTCGEDFLMEDSFLRHTAQCAVHSVLRPRACSMCAQFEEVCPMSTCTT